MKIFRSFKICFILGFISFASAKDNPRVIVLSIDGAKPSVINQAKIPTLKKIYSEGAVSWNAKTIVPSLTLPSHVSMLTGVEPSVHKILWNDWLKENGHISVASVFSLAKKQGLKTALFAAKKKFKHFEVPGTIDSFNIIETGSSDVVKSAVGYLKSGDPQLLFIHLAEVDAAGHAHGWGSSEQVTALEKIDVSLKILFDYLVSVKNIKAYTLIITADHGGTNKGHGSSSDEDTTIPWIAWGERVNKIKLKSSISTKDTAATVLELLHVDNAAMSGNFVSEAFHK